MYFRFVQQISTKLRFYLKIMILLSRFFWHTFSVMFLWNAFFLSLSLSHLSWQVMTGDRSWQVTCHLSWPVTFFLSWPVPCHLSWQVTCHLSWQVTFFLSRPVNCHDLPWQVKERDKDRQKAFHKNMTEKVCQKKRDRKGIILR